MISKREKDKYMEEMMINNFRNLIEDECVNLKSSLNHNNNKIKDKSHWDVF